MTSHSGIIDAAQVTSERVLRLHQYWLDKCGGRPLPARSAIDPIEIPRLLPYVVIAEIEPAPMRVRYRLVGTRVVEANGADYTNRYLDQCNFKLEPLLTECYRRLIAAKAPVFAYYEWFKSDWGNRQGSVGASESGFFPLSGDGATVDFAISLADYDIPPRSTVRA